MIGSAKISTYSPLADSWLRIGYKHHHGINVPLFALRSDKNCGIGEFYDLRPIIDWCQKIGYDIIQLLPLNDTGHEPSPYSALSSCALNPVYLSLSQLPFIDEDAILQEELVTFNKYKRLQRIAYEPLYNAKISFMRLYYDKYFYHFAKSESYQQFLNQYDWLEPYGLFKVLKDRYALSDWKSWHKALRDPSKSHLKKMYKEEKEDISFYVFLQYLCFLQLRQVKQYANTRGIFLKGDIPILVSYESMDLWMYREEFRTDLVVGAPPDVFNPEGQNWGFPLYNWQTIAADGYKWWRKRLHLAKSFFDIYRMDHIIGFFRVWAIPPEEDPTKGSYLPSEEWASIAQGREVLHQLISETDMLPIGEDLGLEVEKIREVMEELDVCGTRVIRWERDHLGDNHFIPYDEYTPKSLTSVSTHDSETLTLWWNDFPDEAKEFCQFRGWRYTKKLSNERRRDILYDSHHTASLFHINLLQEYLALFDTLVWENPKDERINIPGTVNAFNWSYRFRPTIEEIVVHQDLAKEMIALRTSRSSK